MPFLASAILVGVGLFIRLKIMESPAFQRVKETKTEAPKPIVDVVRKYPREVLMAMGMRVAENGCFYILTVFVLAYGEEELGLAKGTMLTGVIIAAAHRAWSPCRCGARCPTASAASRCTWRAP